MAKPFLSFEDQLNKLENEKGLVINNRAYAERKLREIGYFGLIGGYKSPFKNPTTKKYRDGVAFEDIVALYKFDENLRELFLKYILRFERHIRSLLSYYFTEKHGEQQSCYLDPANYVPDHKRRADVAKLIGALNNLATKSSDYPYINHQRTTYGNVPLWVLVNGLTFGTLSKFYALTTPDLRVKISKNFDGVNEKQLGQYLKVIPNSAMFAHTTNGSFPIRQKTIFPIRYCTENSPSPREAHNISAASVICLRWLLLSVIFCRMRILRSSSKAFQKYLLITLQTQHRYPK